MGVMHSILEIGPGTEPCYPNAVKLDARALPGIRYVQDARDLSNIPDCSFWRVASRNCIEHIGWPDTLSTLKEWLRVVMIGGTLEVETTNAEEFIPLLQGEHTLTMWHAKEPIWQHFNRVAYGHQDYPENTHKSYFTPEWLAELMTEAGALDVEIRWRTIQAFLVVGRRGE
jgi:predicted SAM-dependent methyltransferase